MMKREDNEMITRVGPGTPMGEMLREYWAPAARSASLVADGAPLRVRILGENFVAYRATDGRVGFLPEACPHRGASLALGRNEDNSLRCIFHGWKIDLNGKVLETPCEAPGRREAFAASLKVRHHPTREAGGMVWVYLGKQQVPPPFPEFDFNTLPLSHVAVARGAVHYNWVQGLEAHIDSAHLGVLHAGWTTSEDAVARLQPSLANDLRLAAANAAPVMEMEATPYGLREAALRDQGDGNVYSRIRQIALPYFTFIPASAKAPCTARATVPIDDEWDAEWYIDYDHEKPLTEEFLATRYQDASANLDNFTANLGTVENMWHQDRAAMAKGHFSGITRSVAFEDFAVQESMGPLVDRSNEQLAPSDALIVNVRRMLLDAVRGFRDGKPAPWQGGIDYAAVRAVAVTHPKGQNWREHIPSAPVIEDAGIHNVAAE